MENDGAVPKLVAVVVPLLPPPKMLLVVLGAAVVAAVDDAPPKENVPLPVAPVVVVTGEAAPKAKLELAAVAG